MFCPKCGNQAAENENFCMPFHGPKKEKSGKLPLFFGVGVLVIMILGFTACGSETGRSDAGDRNGISQGQTGSNTASVPKDAAGGDSVYEDASVNDKTRRKILEKWNIEIDKTVRSILIRWNTPYFTYDILGRADWGNAFSDTPQGRSGKICLIAGRNLCLLISVQMFGFVV